MKTSWLLLFILLLNAGAMAQKKTFCNAFKQLEEIAGDNFTQIRLAEDTTAKGAFKTYLSSLQIAGAQKTEISQRLGRTVFRGDFGLFDSEDAGKAKVNELIAQMVECFPGFRFHEMKKGIFSETNYIFSNHVENAFRLYDAAFVLKKEGKSNVRVIFEFGGVEKNIYNNMISGMPYTDFSVVNVDKVVDEFSRKLDLVLKESKSAFYNITGDLIEEPNAIFKRYTTETQVPSNGFCTIEDRTMGLVYYVIPLVKEGDAADFQKANNEYLVKIMKALGKDYALGLSADKKKVNFVHKDRPGKNVLSIVVVNRKPQTFDLSIYVDSDKE